MRVVCAGLCTLDTIYEVPALPPPDGRVVATGRIVAGGGTAATAAATLARLGVAVELVSAVGNDDAGRLLRDGLAHEGVDVSHVAVVEGATARSTVLVTPDGSRAIVHHSGAARCPAAVVDADWLHVDHAGYGRVRPGSSTALSIDGGNPIDALDLNGVALYAPTEDTLRAQVGDAEAALRLGAARVVVTRGARGSIAYLPGGEVVEAPALDVDVVSTLGAGDVFHGALLAYLAQSTPLPDALRAANAAAALSCRALDGRSAIPTREELERALG